MQKSMTFNDLERSKRICSHRQPKSNLLRAQRLTQISFTNVFVKIGMLSLDFSAAINTDIFFHLHVLIITSSLSLYLWSSAASSRFMTFPASSIQLCLVTRASAQHNSCLSSCHSSAATSLTILSSSPSSGLQYVM